LGADEDVAIVIARTDTAQSVTDNASLDRGWHGTIFAQSAVLAFGLHPSTLRQASNMKWSAERRCADPERVGRLLAVVVLID
jgi:hypothetical protein